MTTGKLLAAGSAALALIMLAVYLVLIHSQGNRPAIWFVAGLAVAVLLAAYGVHGGVTTLVAAGVLMVGLGLLGILSVGLPIIAAGALAFVAAARRRRPA